MIERTERDPSTQAREFIGFELPPGLGFGQGKLSKPVDFHRSHFCGEVVFAMCELVRADFRSAEFTGPAHLDYAKFHESARFDEACFRIKATFGSARFLGPTYFPNTTFGQHARFDDASFPPTAMPLAMLCTDGAPDTLSPRCQIAIAAQASTTITAFDAVSSPQVYATPALISLWRIDALLTRRAGVPQT